MLSDKDVDDTMAADWAKISDKYIAEDKEPADEKSVDSKEAEPKAEDVEQIPVSREKDGKFKPRETEKAAKAEDKGEVKTAPGETSRLESSDAAVQRDINRAPSSWKPLIRAEFEKLSPQIKAEIHRREQDFQNGQSQLMPDAQMGKQFREVIQPYEMMIKAEGGTPAGAIADLMRTAALFRVGSHEQKLQAVAGIARQFNVDLRALFQQPGTQQQTQQAQQTQQPQFRDPRVDQMLAAQNAERQRLHQQEQAQKESSVNRWMNETGADGNPKRAYLSDVINEMSAMLPQIKQADPTLSDAQALDAAYDRAIWAHPEIRTLLAQKQQSELDAKRKADNQSRVNGARRAASVNVTRRASTPSAGKPGSMEDTIAQTARELGLFG